MKRTNRWLFASVGVVVLLLAGLVYAWTVLQAPAMHVANWFGMKGKPNLHHSEVCCTGYVALEIACAYVASSMYDI